jgi:nitroreductase
MEVFETINKRKSVRKYKDLPVEEEKIKKIVEAARLAPSASNRQPWRFIAIKDKNLRFKIVKETLGIINQWALSAPLLIIGCSVRSNMLTSSIGKIIPMGVRYYILDLGIAMEHIVLQAEELGLSTCWIGWFNEKKIKNILEINPQWQIVSLLSVGYAYENYQKSDRSKYPLEKILIIK